MVLKNPDDVIKVLEGRLQRDWHHVAVGTDIRWSSRLPLGTLPSTQIAAAYTTHAKWVRGWGAWADRHGLDLVGVGRRVGSVPVTFPEAVLIPTPDGAAAVVGGEWVRRLDAGRARAALLRREFPVTTADPAVLARVVRGTDGWAELDLEILVKAGHWFTRNSGAGYTPRQVDIDGAHAKWLNTSQYLVATLAGREQLELDPPHQPTVEFTYLDPEHLAARHRRHDAYTLGDVVELPYRPLVVLICENKDTVVKFPPVSGGIAVQGNGSGAGAVANTPWVREAPLVVYWGDMDADGLEILAQFKKAGVVHTSMLMDDDAYERFGHLGTNYDKRQRPLTGRPVHLEPGDLPDGEWRLYKQLCSPDHAGFRRVEQERIRLTTAHETLLTVVAEHTASITASPS